jgi:serine/threonine protein kinase
MSNPPEKIGKYEIVQEVGRGSMGTVYSAHDPFSDRLVAFKLPHPHFVDQSEEGLRFRKLFFNEAHAASTLDHPNLVKVLDADVDGELCYLVMEFVDGAQTFDQYVKPDRLLS